MIGIYKFINSDNKIYIGCSTNIEKRMKTHQYNHNIINFEVIEQCPKSSLLEREKFWIEHYKSCSEGLNGNNGGGGTINHSCETKELISKARRGWAPSIERGVKIGLKLKGKACSEEKKLNISRGNKGVSRGKGRISPNKGNKYSKEVCNKMSNSKKGIIFTKNQKELMSQNQWKKKKIKQYNLDGSFIKEWDSSTDAGKVLGKSCNSISDCASGRQKTAYGFKWCY